MSVPTFLIIGAPKAGTTSLHYYLAEHPEVYVYSKLKEVRFFAYDADNPSHAAKGGREFPITTWEDYQALFDDAAGFPAIGESSPQYLGSLHAAERIASRLPNVRIIAVLRNPVDRAVSAFLQDVRNRNAKLKAIKKINSSVKPKTVILPLRAHRGGRLKIGITLRGPHREVWRP